MADPGMDLWAIDEVHFQQHGSRCRMWIAPENRDPVLHHEPTRKSVETARQNLLYHNRRYSGQAGICVRMLRVTYPTRHPAKASSFSSMPKPGPCGKTRAPSSTWGRVVRVVSNEGFGLASISSQSAPSTAAMTWALA